MKKLIIEILIKVLLDILQKRIEKRKSMLSGTNIEVTNGMEETVICFIENLDEEEKDGIAESLSRIAVKKSVARKRNKSKAQNGN